MRERLFVFWKAKQVSEINWQQIRADYEAGMSLRALQAKYGVSKSAIGERKFKERWDSPGRTPNRTESRTAPTVRPTQNENPTPQKEEGLSTKDRQRLFLEAYAVHANIMLSARAAGIHRSTVYDWQEHDEDFAFAFNLAKEDAKDTLKAEIFRRAKEGWEEPVYQFGQYAGTVRKYSDTLLIFHAKMLMPEYRDKSTVDVNANVNTHVSGALTLTRGDLRQLSDEELAQVKALLAAAKARKEG